MRRTSLSIRSLLLLIAILAVGLALIASQSRLGADAALTLFWTGVLLSLSGAIVGRAGVRAFGVGAAVFGLGYWALAFETEEVQTSGTVRLRALRLWQFGGVAPSRPEPAAGRFLTADLIDWIEDSVRPRVAVGGPVDAQYKNGSYYTGKVLSFDGTSYIIAWDDGTQPSAVPPAGIRGLVAHVRTSAHAVFGLAFALFGGLATVGLFHRSSGDRRAARPARPGDPSQA